MSATEPEPAEELRRVYDDKVAAELAAADRIVPGSDRIRASGDPYGHVMLVKGLPGPAEASGDSALAGADGEAARKALAALGFDPSSVFATLSRPLDDIDDDSASDRLALQIEAVDPVVIVALDEVAAKDLSSALGTDLDRFGVVKSSDGRLVLALDGLEASLCDDARKRTVWAQLQALSPPKPVW